MPDQDTMRLLAISTEVHNPLGNPSTIASKIPDVMPATHKLTSQFFRIRDSVVERNPGLAMEIRSFLPVLSRLLAGRERNEQSC